MSHTHTHEPYHVARRGCAWLTVVFRPLRNFSEFTHNTPPPAPQPVFVSVTDRERDDHDVRDIESQRGAMVSDPRFRLANKYGDVYSVAIYPSRITHITCPPDWISIWYSACWHKGLGVGGVMFVCWFLIYLWSEDIGKMLCRDETIKICLKKLGKLKAW